MTQAPSQAPIVAVKPQPNLYTVLLVLAIVALAATIGMVLYNLLADVAGGAGYGLTFGEVLTGKLPG